MHIRIRMNFLERVLSNYFLAWSQIFNYKDKTSRIPFWHFFILDGLIGPVVSILSNNNLANDPNDFIPSLRAMIGVICIAFHLF